MPSIQWDPGDSAGTRTLPCIVDNGRFNRWKMMPRVVGEVAEAVGDGRGYVWKHRTDNVASMELLIAHDDAALIDEFIKWAMGDAGAGTFGLFDIHTDDTESNVYTDVQIKVGTEIDVSPPDPETLDWTLSMTVVDVSASPVPLLIRHE
jgi:hypothetical protein